MNDKQSRQDIVKNALDIVAEFFYPNDKRAPAVRVSRLLDISEQAVYMWVRKGEVPGKWAVELDRRTYGKVKREDLNPSLFR